MERFRRCSSVKLGQPEFSFLSAGYVRTRRTSRTRALSSALSHALSQRFEQERSHCDEQKSDRSCDTNQHNNRAVVRLYHSHRPTEKTEW